MVYKVGMRIKWNTISGAEYEGVIIEIDSNVLVIKLDDGTIKCLET